MASDHTGILAKWCKQMTVLSKNATPDTTTPELELDESSLSAIRSILTQDAQPVPRTGDVHAEMYQAPDAGLEPRPPVGRLRRKVDALPELADPVYDGEMALEGKSASKLHRRKRWFSFGRKAKVAPPKVEKPVAHDKFEKPVIRDEIKKPAVHDAVRKPVARDEAASGPRDLMSRVRGYRPKPAHLALGAFAILVVTRPWLVLGLTFLFLFIMVGVFLMVGYDGFWQGVMKANRWYANRRPSRAAVLHARLDRFAMRWDAVLDRFPEGTVDGLYLPDFGEMAIAEQRHDEALERRLAGLGKSGA